MTLFLAVTISEEALMSKAILINESNEICTNKCTIEGAQVIRNFQRQMYVAETAVFDCKLGRLAPKYTLYWL